MSKKINVCMDYLVGGALVGLRRISGKLIQYDWSFTTEVDPSSDLVFYLNNNRFYNDAKKYNIPFIIQRKTGERSLKIPVPKDLDAVICASKRSFEATSHNKKVLIYNGIDFDYLKSIRPKKNIDLLIAESRIGRGQRVNIGCEYAIKHNRKLHILGSRQNLHENTYKELKKKYPMHNWVGLVSEDEALSYIKGCNAIIISNPVHGVANQIIEAVAMDKKIINFGKCEIPDKKQIDIKKTTRLYLELFEKIFSSC